MKRAIGFLVFLGLFGGAVWVGLESSHDQVRRVEGQMLFEDVDQKTRAEIFAFRALAHNDLMNPVGPRTYNWTYEEDTIQTEIGWRVGFAASDCAPRRNSHTCRGLSGEDPELGNAVSDIWLEVSLSGGRWEVLGVGGNTVVGDERVVGYSLPDEREPSHWDFASVGRWDRSLLMTPIWVGPYPTDALGSVCAVRSQGNPADVFYMDAPNQPFERGGWVRGSQLPAEEDQVPEVTCRQYTGAGWAVVGSPRLVEGVGEIQGVEATIAWQGDRRFTAPVECRASLVDEDGNLLWEGDERRQGLWPPPKPGDHSLEMEIFINVANGVAGGSLRSLECRSL